jgi:hypothetical protein
VPDRSRTTCGRTCETVRQPLGDSDNYWRSFSAGVFVLLSLLNFAATGDESEPPWEFERYADPMHPGAYIAAATQTSAPNGDRTVAILVRCWNATNEIDVRLTMSAVKPQDYSEEVVWQFDNKPRQTGRWRAAPSGLALVVPDSMKDAFLRQLRESRRVAIAPGPNSDLSFSVALRGSSQAIGNVLQTCRRQ